jgi:hypothetical protein
MIKKQNPFINELRKKIDQILKENKRQSLEAEIKKLTDEVCLNFDEEKYLRLSSLKKTRDEMLLAAEAENI